MSEVYRTLGGALAVALAAFILREVGFRGARLVALLGVLSLSALALLRVGEIADELLLRPELLSLGESATAALTLLGTAYLFSLAADICRGIGEEGIASSLEFLARAEIVVMALPTLIEILNVAEEIVGYG